MRYSVPGARSSRPRVSSVGKKAWPLPSAGVVLVRSPPGERKNMTRLQFEQVLVIRTLLDGAGHASGH